MTDHARFSAKKKFFIGSKIALSNYCLGVGLFKDVYLAKPQMVKTLDFCVFC